MSYDFSSLSHPDFESLCLDLAGAHADLRFEAFSPGPDGGIDGRHAKANELTILQVKHYRGSSFSDLKRAMRHEQDSIETLQPTRYILATSHSLTPDNKAALAEIIGCPLQSESDILGPAELIACLGKTAVSRKRISSFGYQARRSLIRSSMPHSAGSPTRPRTRSRGRLRSTLRIQVSRKPLISSKSDTSSSCLAHLASGKPRSLKYWLTDTWPRTGNS
ncbi:restriction endonuclease [Bradyrhizobium sp. 169]|nr:restriction endonuclease [Bradyrhizobium sp. 169]